MMACDTSNGTAVIFPKWFGFFTGLCLVIGVAGLLGNGIFLAMNISHGLSPKAPEFARIFWLSALHLTRSAGYVAGWAMARSRIVWARLLIIACAATSLLELLYNTIDSLTKGVIQPTPATLAYFLVPLILEGSILWYFFRRPISAVAAARPS